VTPGVGSNEWEGRPIGELLVGRRLAVVLAVQLVVELLLLLLLLAAAVDGRLGLVLAHVVLAMGVRRRRRQRSSSGEESKSRPEG
jgi:hypothetical protein